MYIQATWPRVPPDDGAPLGSLTMHTWPGPSARAGAAVTTATPPSSPNPLHRATTLVSDRLPGVAAPGPERSPPSCRRLSRDHGAIFPITLISVPHCRKSGGTSLPAGAHCPWSGRRHHAGNSDHTACHTPPLRPAFGGIPCSDGYFNVTGCAAEHVGGATEVERWGSDGYGGSGWRVSPVWPRNPSMRAGRYWMRLSRFLTMVASWSTLRAARLPRPFFMFAQAPSAGVRSGAKAGSWMTGSQSGGAPVNVRIPALMWVLRLSQIRMTGACSW